MRPGVDLWSLGEKAGPAGGMECWWGEAGGREGGGEPETWSTGCGGQRGEKDTAHQALGAEKPRAPQPPLRLASSVSRSLNYG